MGNMCIKERMSSSHAHFAYIIPTHFYYSVTCAGFFLLSILNYLPWEYHNTPFNLIRIRNQILSFVFVTKQMTKNINEYMNLICDLFGWIWFILVADKRFWSDRIYKIKLVLPFHYLVVTAIEILVELNYRLKEHTICFFVSTF